MGTAELLVWVWQEPPQKLPAGCVPLVRAANGRSTTDPQGFDFRDNYAQWAKLYPEAPAWTYCYAGDDGPADAAALLRAAPAASAHVADIEQAWLASEAVEFVRRIPGAWISTWGELSQVRANGVPLGPFARVMPQVYFPYQLAPSAVSAWVAWQAQSPGTRQVAPTLSPTDAPGQWADAARGFARRSWGISLWRLGILTPAILAEAVAIAREETDMRGFIAPCAGAQWAIDHDLRGRRMLPSPQDVAALLATGDYVAAGLTEQLVAAIPILQEAK